jgi:hypothetical protein
MEDILSEVGLDRFQEFQPDQEHQEKAEQIHQSVGIDNHDGRGNDFILDLVDDIEQGQYKNDADHKNDHPDQCFLYIFQELKHGLLGFHLYALIWLEKFVDIRISFVEHVFLCQPYGSFKLIFKMLVNIP